MYASLLSTVICTVPCGILGITMEHRCGQYSVANCRCDVGLSMQCFRLRPSKMDVSTFEDGCVDFQRLTIDVSTFKEGCVDFRRWMIDVPTLKIYGRCRPLKTDDRCEIMLLHLLKTLMV